jgi:hypothetical protein
MDVGGWLRSLGLAQYEDAFRDNAIDDSVLPNLTVDDLKDLGVGIVGHRRKLFDAIVALRAYAMTRRYLRRAAIPTITGNQTRDCQQKRPPEGQVPGAFS